MTYAGWEFVPEDRQLFGRTLGEALARLARDRWPRGTTKMVAKAWDLDLGTAENLTKGHASERTITKAIRAEGWDLLGALGHALTGQTYEQWLEAKLTTLIDESNRAAESIRSLRARRERLEAGAASLDLAGAGEVAPAGRRADGIVGGGLG